MTETENKERKEELHKRGLFMIIQDVHMTNTGATERDLSCQAHDRGLLMWKLEKWVMPNGDHGSFAYDMQVKFLLETVLNEKVVY